MLCQEKTSREAAEGHSLPSPAHAQSLVPPLLLNDDA